MLKIIDGIYSIEGLRIGHSYVILGQDGLTLVDTSAPGSLPQIERELQSIGQPLNAIKRILLTHAHWDHYGSLVALQQVTGAQVYVHHRYESAVIRGEKRPLRPAYTQLGTFDRLLFRAWVKPKERYTIATRVDHELKEGDRLDMVRPGLEVVDIPGHSPGQCAFWLPEQRLLFGGDVVMRSPLGRLLLPMVAATPDIAEAKRSIRKIAEMNLDILCQGHGKPLVSNASHALKNFVQTLD